MSQYSHTTLCDNVTELAQCLNHFATLVTDTKILPETPILRDESRLSRMSQIEKEASIQNSLMKNKAALIWLKIALNEGHIEPSQPTVGGILGWPCRKFFAESLYVDFLLWCKKQRISQQDIDQRDLFLSLMDKIFLREGIYYSFPTLDICRNKLLTLKAVQ